MRQAARCQFPVHSAEEREERGPLREVLGQAVVLLAEWEVPVNAGVSLVPGLCQVEWMGTAK
ncbi:MAG: hypothetical protein CBB71_10705 [Rhodopirellula sp. TMED11]|nr:MAG: hypothetical protein CBB71_10705 [Rhodopirellula sp. TMED11]